MKKILFILLLSVLISCTPKEEKNTTWIINKVDGGSDTIQARKYWILSPDTLFIKFEIDDTTRIIYNRSGIESFQRKN